MEITFGNQTRAEEAIVVWASRTFLNHQKSLLLNGALSDSCRREDRPMDRCRVRHIRPFGVTPQDPVKFVLRRPIVLAEIHTGGLFGAGGFLRVFGK